MALVSAAVDRDRCAVSQPAVEQDHLEAAVVSLQAMGKPLDGRSDLFSLGVTLYKLACGSTPFDAHPSHAERNGALVRGRWEPLERVFPQPGGLYEVLGKSMKLKPDDRWPTARAMREELEKAAWESGFRAGHSSLLGYVDAAGEISAVPSSRHPVIAAAATAVETRATPSPLPPPAPALIPAPRRHTERMVPGARPPPRAKPPGWLMKVRKIESENWRVAQMRLRLGGLLQGNGERREGRLERRLASGAQTGAGEVVAGEAPERYASDSSSWGGAWVSATGRR